ncbi:hypothetical protein EW026_g4356 [Hermanssonia centrifuga]|uniref:1-phosphatidylinositol 4-kinase n=1 Tax=Hermanssonia centrifuga TaxID=98765 RepID=A0A4S4KJ57_9APHY|nr:hypothetical protein EW026_g4356 [Hermanssonia centrifuga]
MAPPKRDRAKVAADQLTSKAYFSGEASGFYLARILGMALWDQHVAGLTITMHLDPRREDTQASPQEVDMLKSRMADAILEIMQKKKYLDHHRFKASLIPLCIYDHLFGTTISAGIDAWSWVISEKAEYETAIMSELTSAWIETIKHEKGMFSIILNYSDPFYHSVQYSPSDREAVERAARVAYRALLPHTLILQLLVSRLQAASRARVHMSTHPLAREARFSLLLFGFEALRSSYLDDYCEHQMRDSLYKAAFSWFAVRPQWSYGANRIQIDTDVKVLSEFLSYLQGDAIRGLPAISSFSPMQSVSNTSYYRSLLKTYNTPLRLLVDNEIFRLTVWANPSSDLKRGIDHVGTIEKLMTEPTWVSSIRTVWQLDPAIAVYMTERFHHVPVLNEVTHLVRSNTKDVLDIPEALRFLVGERIDVHIPRDLKYLLLWAPTPPVLAITFFEKRYHNDPLLLQYAHRVLEQHPVDLTFFFCAAEVYLLSATLIQDEGYVARFIFETAKISQLFCHQIIWNMKANCYKDDAAEVEDPMKPVLDRMTDMVVSSLSGEAREFYDREFTFFNKVTSISGKLKPFIKKTKPEKKAKIDEEMAKIHVDVGVYLPSNPDGQVVDIDKKSGRPLQSHAKAPFMATFKVRKTRTAISEDVEILAEQENVRNEEYEVWQAAIFKVGDDCRQDVLALQIIAMFKNIFNTVGLTVYLFPYRVTATAPGCGVIDVVPNATSRDEMGRAKVNDLLDFFVAKYGGEDTVEFQKARLNFIQSMAAYSVACYILQIKDRHNGNIMIDGEGHIVHIDQLVSTVQLMLDTSLPSFKGEPTIRRLNERFALGLNERQAAEWMMAIVRNAHENVRSTAYDEFQRATNWDVKRSIGAILHSDEFFDTSEPKARLINFKVTLNRSQGVQNDGSGLLILPSRTVAQKLLKYVYGQGKAILVKDRKIHFQKSGRKPDPRTTETLEKTPYLDPEIEEEREAKLEKLDVGLHVDKLQIGVFYRMPEDPPNASRLFSNEFEFSHRHKGAGLLHIEYDHKLIRLQLGDPVTEELAYNVVITFANIRKLAIGYDFGNPFACFELWTPPVFQLERFNRELTGRDWNDSRKYRQRLESINASHGAIAPYAHQLRIILHETKDLEDFSYLCTVAGLPRPIKAHMEAFSNGFYAARKLHNLYLHFKEFDWRVAFQMEAMLRNGLINTQELLQQLYQPIKDLCSCQPATAADTLRLFTDALRSPDLRQSKIDRFRQICGRDPSESLSAHRLSKGNFLCHHVTITPTRMLLEGPFVIQSNRVIRKYQGYEEHFIRVDFRDEDRLQYRWERDTDGTSLLQTRVGGILKNGFQLGGRQFEFLAYSSSALRQHAVWFVHPFQHHDLGFLDAERIRMRLGDFSGVITKPSKYAARMAQAFTATDPSVRISRDQWEEVEDMGAEPYLFTDGVGTISSQLGDMIWEALCADRGESYKQRNIKPSAYQIRFLGYKGMVAVDDQLEGIRMRLRESMNKFEGPKDDFAEIEIARAFERPGTCYLNRPLIMVLEDREVDKKVFLDLQEKAVAEIHMASDSLMQSGRILRQNSLGTAYGLPFVLQFLKAIGMGMEYEKTEYKLRDPFLDRLVHFAKNHVLRSLKHAARIPVHGSYLLVGVADEGPAYEAAGHQNVFRLEDGEVFVCVQQEPDDEPQYIEVQRVRAIGKPPDGGLCLFRNLKNVVVLPSVGVRSLASCLGGGDLDGDLYSVITDSALLPTRHVDPADYTPVGTRDLERESRIEDICDFVVEYINSDVLGLLSDRHLVIAGELFRNVRLLEKDQMPSYDTNGNNSRPRPLSDNISQALKSYITDVLGQSGFYNKDADVAAMAPLFRGYVEELKYICLTHSLYDSPDSRLVEEEVVIGTILANCSQNRHRTDRMYRLRLNASVLVWDIRRRIYERTETPTAGELRYGLTQAWLAWDFGKRNKGIFGANSFTFIALAVIADILDTMGAVDVKRAGKRSNDEE